MAKKKKPRQGAPIEGVPCALEAIPVGACVQFTGDKTWWLVAGKIAGDVTVIRMGKPPTDPTWPEHRLASYLLWPTVWAVAAVWPVRDSDNTDGVIDPVSQTVQDDGDLFKRHAWER